jgi:hypothetical protein
MTIDGVPVQTSPITIATVEDCDAVILEGTFEAGETVPCPHGDHEHYLLDVLHTVAVHNISIVEIND